MILDDEMKFAEHFKILRALGIFSRAAKFLPASAKITLYNTLIFPHIDYIVVLFGQTHSVKNT